MLNLAGKVIAIKNLVGKDSGVLLRLCGDVDLSVEDRAVSGYLLQEGDLPEGFRAYIGYEDQQELLAKLPPNLPLVVLPGIFRYLSPGDLIVVSPNDLRMRVLYRRNSRHNSFLITERCDNYCLMCSQPPKEVADDWIADEIMESIRLVDSATEELGFTGGEPTLIGDRFIDILAACKHYLPNTSIHVLSNGRRFSDATYAKKWAAIDHPDLMVGIPVYADVSTVHDYVVQADGAFDETIRGVLNLKRLGQRVEIRVVIHQQTYAHLPRLAEFITRNLLFVDHVALMGLEIIGFTRANLPSLWIDPVEYKKELYDAVRILDAAGVRTSIYNHQLCLIDRRLWQFAVKSISDWKNEYYPECSDCRVRDECGGFFFSAKYKRSAHISPVLTA